MAPHSCCCSPGAVRRRLPLLAWLPRYSVQWLKMDFIAGLSVGLTVIPQALAYAEVAGLPPQYGLYSAFMGCFVYIVLGTSRDVTLGPTAIMSLLVSFYTFHEPAYAVLLAFLSGCIQLAMGLLCLGFLLDFISCPVIKGFTSAAAVTIGFGQVKNLLGLQDIPRQFFLQVYRTFLSIGETRVGDAVLGLVCMLLLLALKLMRGHMPPVHPEMPLRVRLSHGLVWTATTARNALVVSCAALVAYSFELTGHQPFILTGETAEGLPPVRLPPFWVTTANGTVSFTEMVQDMGAGLAVVPLMGLLESIAVAKAFASQNSYRIDTNQELLAIGLTNMLGSLVSSYPVTGSFGRTAVNAQSGVCTPAGGLVTGRAGCRHHHGRGPAVRHQDLRDAVAREEYGSPWWGQGARGPRTLRAPRFSGHTLSALPGASPWSHCCSAQTGRSLPCGPLGVPDCPCPACGDRRASRGPQVGRARESRQPSQGRPSSAPPGLDLLPLCVTFLLCFWEVQYGILAGTLVSVLVLLHSVARPETQVSEEPFLVLQPASGLHFPAVEALREAILSRALRASPPRCAILDCTHVCSVDYTAVLGLGELLEDFRRRGVRLVFLGLQVPVLRVLLCADLKGFQYFSTLEEAEKFLEQEAGTQPYNSSEDPVPELRTALLKA